VPGRDRDIRILDDLSDHVHERGGALMVRGEAGISWSELLEATSAHRGD
jgi:hypothetical protein